MLPSIDLKAKNQEVKIFLVNSRNQVIGRVKEADSISYDINAGKLNEISFTIPLYIDDLTKGLTKNKHTDILIDRAMIKAEYNQCEEIFVIDSVDDSNEGQRNLHAFSLGILLNDKILSGYKSQTKKITDGKTEYVDSPIDIAQAIKDALQKNRIWQIGTIDSKLQNIYRSFEFDSQTPLEYLYQIGEKFNAILEWDTINKKINAYHPDNYGQDRGFKITDDKYITSITKKYSDDEFCTRLFLYGKDGLDVNSVNRNGQSYIEDFSYFMNNGQMSETLKTRLLSYDNYLNSRKTEFPTLLTELQNEQTALTKLQQEFNTYQTNEIIADNNCSLAKSVNDFYTFTDVYNSVNKTFTHSFDENHNHHFYFFKLQTNGNPTITFGTSENIQYVVDNNHWYALKFEGSSNLTMSNFTNSVTLTGYIVGITTDEYTNDTVDDLNTNYNYPMWTEKMNAKQIEIDAKNIQIQQTQAQIKQLQTDESIDGYFTAEELNELDQFIIEKEYSDENIIDAQTLLTEGQKQLSERNKPQISFDVSLVNFLNLLEEKRNWDKISIFDKIRIKSNKIDTDIKANIINMKIDKDSINLTIANTKDIKSAQDKFIQLLYGSVNSTKQLAKKEYTWDDAYKVKNNFNNYVNSAIDANKQKIIAGVDETVVIDEKGLKITSPKDPNSYLIANHGILGITHNNGETWENAITTEGIVGEKLKCKILKKITKNVII